MAHYYRRVHIGKLANEDRLVLQYPRLPFDRIDFHAGPEKLRPVVRRVPPEAGEGKTTWELEFDLSGVRAGSAANIEIEATVHDFEARKGERENWLRYSPPAPTEQASVGCFSRNLGRTRTTASFATRQPSPPGSRKSRRSSRSTDPTAQSSPGRSSMRSRATLRVRVDDGMSHLV